VFEYADSIFVVTDPSFSSQAKICQFTAQHNVFERIRKKAMLVANKDAPFIEPFVGAAIHLPYVQTTDASVVYKTLAGSTFEAWAGEIV
jgi:hypothetical protein